MGIISQRLRDSARNQPCTLRLPGVCNHDPATTVLAHLPSEIHGMGTKSDDFHGVFACSACHAALDQRDIDHERIDGVMLTALQRTIRHWIVNGDLIIAGLKDDPKPKKSSKTLPPRRAFYRRATIVNKGKS